MNTCPVYLRSGGLSYGATYTGPIGVILNPGFDRDRYRELPFHSSLCGSCSEVCPVKIDIADQIYKWRRVVVEKGFLKASKKVGMSAIGMVLVHDAYGQLDFTSNNYGLFMAGPSGTGDVEGVIIHGAQAHEV